MIELKVSTKVLRSSALGIIKGVHRGAHAPGFDFIALALRGKKLGFKKVSGMIDDLVAELKQEQQHDNDKRSMLTPRSTKLMTKRRPFEKTKADIATSTTDGKEGSAITKEEIDALEDGTRALDKSVAEATEQRQEENDCYKTSAQQSAAAKELIGFAKNRMSKHPDITYLV